MTRKRVWEIGAAMLLMLAVALVIVILARQKRLNDRILAAHDARTVTALLAQGASVHARDPEGWTPLMLAAGGGNADRVRILIDAGAAVNAKSQQGQTALAIAEANQARLTGIIQQRLKAPIVAGGSPSAAQWGAELRSARERYGAVIRLLKQHGGER